MQIVSAMLPEPPESQDRVFTTPNAAIVLDGASAFVPVEVSTGLYVDTLGGRLQSRILADPTVGLIDALAEAIQYTTAKLDLHPGASPSSTVAIAREHDADVDLLVLGDTQIVTPQGTMRDERIDAVATEERRAYQERLRSGHGYDDEHRALMRALQSEQARHRNQPDGYWIAEATYHAANHALRARLRTADVPWIILASDGFYKPVERLGLDDWTLLAKSSRDNLKEFAINALEWEIDDDPAGIKFPRAKPSDDKTILVAFLD